MKKTYIALAVLAMAALAGCQMGEEFRDDTYTPEKGEIVFTLANNARTTKSSDSRASVQGAVIPIESNDGVTLFLEETITELNDIAFEPQTKGTPAYTENFSALYGNFKAAAFKTSGNGYESSAFDDGVFDKLDNKDMWRRKFGNDIKSHLPLYFFLRAPYDQEGSTVKNPRYFPTTTADTLAGSIIFNYDGSTLTSASAQKDLLFTSREVTEDEYDAFIDKNTGIPVLFHHALTGVKFANFFDNPDLDTKTYITKVEITGLKDGGKCVITPRQEESTGYKDNKMGDFSSADVVVWSDLTDKDVTYTQTFDENGADEIDYASSGNFGDKGTYTGTSWATAGNANNLNKADGSLTFWFVPQQLTENVKMTVYYTVVNTKNANATPHKDSKTIDFGDLTRVKIGEDVVTDDDGKVVSRTPVYGDYANWKAGQLRTYTLKPKYIKVDLVDKMDKFVKSEVKITNNGNVYQYVRVNMIGNWMGLVCSKSSSAAEDATLTYPADSPENYVILMGYPNNTKNNAGEYTAQKMVNPWNDKDFYSNGAYRTIDANDMFMSPYTAYGTFVNLPCMADEPAEGQAVGDGGSHGHWIRHDKYYYYMLPIGPGDSITENLFDSYTVGVSPTFWIADKWGTRRQAKNVHLEMDLAVQAIEAPMNADGTTAAKTYREAWTEVLNPNNDPKFNINDL